MLPRYLLILLIITMPGIVAGQYFQYSQYNFSTQRVNPAMAGLTRYATAGTQYRHQQTGGDFSINSNFVNFSYPLLNSSTGVPWSGIAVSLHNDQSAAIFKTQEVSLGYAVHVRMSRYQTLSFGAKGMFQSRKIGLDGFYTGSQYVTDRGFDLSRSSGENFPELRSSFRTFSAGLYWQAVDKKGRVLHHFGVSMFDVNKPKDSFFGTETQLASTMIVNVGVQSYSHKGVNVLPEGLLAISSGAPMIVGGVRLQKELNVSAKKPSDLVDVILKYAVRRSAIAGIQLHRENISIGLSYDFPMFVKNPGNIGALEFGLELRRLVQTRAQKQVAKRRKATAEKQALAKKQPEQKATTSKEVTPVESPSVTKADTTRTVIEAVTIEETKSQEDAKGTATAGQIRQDRMIIEKVTLHFPFEFNSSDLDDETEAFLDELAGTLKGDENLRLKIEGHTDNIGSDKFNLRLSQKRAESVRTALIKKGIAPERLSAEGKGLREPVNGNETEADRARNRRVEILVYY